MMQEKASNLKFDLMNLSRKQYDIWTQMLRSLAKKKLLMCIYKTGESRESRASILN